MPGAPPTSCACGRPARRQRRGASPGRGIRAADSRGASRSNSGRRTRPCAVRRRGVRVGRGGARLKRRAAAAAARRGAVAPGRAGNRTRNRTRNRAGNVGGAGATERSAEFGPGPAGVGRLPAPPAAAVISCRGPGISGRHPPPPVAAEPAVRFGSPPPKDWVGGAVLL